MRLRVVVPNAEKLKPASALSFIREGSAIVVDPSRPEICYYEGNLYGSVNLVEFIDKISCAAGRLVTRYPTVAMAGIDTSSVIPVAEFDYNIPGGVSNVQVLDKDTLTGWAGEEAL